MCKIFVITDMSQVKSVPKTVNAISRALGSEDDGFGYAIQTAKGLYGERTLYPDEFLYSMKRESLDFPFLTKTYSRFGTIGKPTGAGIFHGRTSTNNATLVNTHPLIKHGWALVHNGVVTDHGPKYEMQTTNDTEHVLERLATGGIESVTTNLTGYYAVAAFDPQGRLHTLRDDRARLYFARVSTIDSYILATTRESIDEVCKTLNWECSIIEMLADNHYLVWQGNDIVSQTQFQPRGSTLTEDRHAYASLGEGVGEVYGEIYGSETTWSGVEVARTVDDVFSEDELQFFDELQSMDSSYTVLDFRNNRIPVDEFLSYSQAEQLACTVIRPDGTVCSAIDYELDRLYMGGVS